MTGCLYNVLVPLPGFGWMGIGLLVDNPAVQRLQPPTFQRSGWQVGGNLLVQQVQAVLPKNAEGFQSVLAPGLSWQSARGLGWPTPWCHCWNLNQALIWGYRWHRRAQNSNHWNLLKTLQRSRRMQWFWRWLSVSHPGSRPAHSTLNEWKPHLQSMLQQRSSTNCGSCSQREIHDKLMPLQQGNYFELPLLFQRLTEWCAVCWAVDHHLVQEEIQQKLETPPKCLKMDF